MRNYEKEVLEVLKGKKYVVTNTDLDGLLSLAIVQYYYPELSFGGWYNNESLFLVDGVKKKDIVALDISFTKDLGIDSISNHVEIDCTGISCNSHIGQHNYHRKSMFSTALLLLASIDKQRIYNMTEEQLMLLLTVDSTYYGWYQHNGRFREVLREYLQIYNLHNIINLLEKKEFRDFERIKQDNNTYKDYRGNIEEFDTERFLRHTQLGNVINKIGFGIPLIRTDYNLVLVGKWSRCETEFYPEIAKRTTVMSNAMTYRDTVFFTQYKNYYYANKKEGSTLSDESRKEFELIADELKQWRDYWGEEKAIEMAISLYGCEEIDFKELEDATIVSMKMEENNLIMHGNLS